VVFSVEKQYLWLTKKISVIMKLVSSKNDDKKSYEMKHFYCGSLTLEQPAYTSQTNAVCDDIQTSCEISAISVLNKLFNTPFCVCTVYTKTVVT